MFATAHPLLRANCFPLGLRLEQERDESVDYYRVPKRTEASTMNEENRDFCSEDDVLERFAFFWTLTMSSRQIENKP